MFRTIFQWKMGPKSKNRVHFPLDKIFLHWTKWFYEAGQSFGDRCTDLKKWSKSWLIRLQRSENVDDLDYEMKGIYYLPVNNKELVSTGYGEYLGNKQKSNFVELCSNSSPKIPLHVHGKSLPILLARPACLNKLKWLTSILRGWKLSSDFAGCYGFFWVGNVIPHPSLQIALSISLFFLSIDSSWCPSAPDAPGMDDSWLRSSNNIFKASCGLPSKPGLVARKQISKIMLLVSLECPIRFWTNHPASQWESFKFKHWPIYDIYTPPKKKYIYIYMVPPPPKIYLFWFFTGIYVVLQQFCAFLQILDFWRGGTIYNFFPSERIASTTILAASAQVPLSVCKQEWHLNIGPLTLGYWLRDTNG